MKPMCYECEEWSPSELLKTDEGLKGHGRCLKGPWTRLEGAFYTLPQDGCQMHRPVVNASHTLHVSQIEALKRYRKTETEIVMQKLCEALAQARDLKISDVDFAGLCNDVMKAEEVGS